MKRPFVSLRPEITRAHAVALMDWLEDERVTRYLSDPSSISRVIGQAVERTQMPVLTHLFNQGGRFFMVYDRNDSPVGFVRLIKSGPECEMVLVIGDHDSWGQRLGASAIRESLKLAFLELRAATVIAKIHPENTRSLKAFARAGFAADRETPTLVSLSMNARRYRQLLREPAMAGAPEIFVTELDLGRLQDVIYFEQGPALVELEHELERATIVAPQDVAPTVVTMNSRVALRVDEEEAEVALVYPNDADERAGKLSVLSDVGAAILGYREGDAIEWVVAERTQRIRIDRVTYQPESSGDFSL